MKHDRIIDGCLWPAGSQARLEDIQEVGAKFRYTSHSDAIFTTEEGDEGVLAARHPDGTVYYTPLDTIDESCIELVEDEEDDI